MSDVSISERALPNIFKLKILESGNKMMNHSIEKPAGQLNFTYQALYRTVVYEFALSLRWAWL